MHRLTKNEYGVKLNSNGYAPTIMEHRPLQCYRCHRYADTARHEIFGGALRSKSKQYGLWINVCPDCHQAIHGSGELQAEYHKRGQLAAMAHYHWTKDDFRHRFYKNYVFEED